MEDIFYEILSNKKFQNYERIRIKLYDAILRLTGKQFFFNSFYSKIEVDVPWIRSFFLSIVNLQYTFDNMIDVNFFFFKLLYNMVLYSTRNKLILSCHQLMIQLLFIPATISKIMRRYLLLLVIVFAELLEISELLEVSDFNTIFEKWINTLKGWEKKIKKNLLCGKDR